MARSVGGNLIGALGGAMELRVVELAVVFLKRSPKYYIDNIGEKLALTSPPKP